MKRKKLAAKPIKQPKIELDPRVKRQAFAWKRLWDMVFIFAILAVGLMLLLDHFNAQDVMPEMFGPLFFYWYIVSALYSIITTVNIYLQYEKPMREISKAARKVADGDFSVRLKPKHTDDKLSYFDVTYLDFNKMVEELCSTETLKSDFVSNVSHEIKTPLAVVQNYATLLQSDDLTKEQRKEYSTTIFFAAEQLSSLVTNILRLNKLENQAITPAPQPFDVSRQLSECVLNYADYLESKNIDFYVELEDEAMIAADQELLYIVWSNLLSNAIKFAEPGGKISLIQTSDEDMVTVQVADTGCGMDEKTIKHIFDKFYQGDTSHSKDGYGLGLALVFKIVQLYDGEISVKSELGKGSVFSVQFKKAANAANGT